MRMKRFFSDAQERDPTEIGTPLKHPVDSLEDFKRVKYSSGWRRIERQPEDSGSISIKTSYHCAALAGAASDYVFFWASLEELDENRNMKKRMMATRTMIPTTIDRALNRSLDRSSRSFLNTSG